MPDDRHPGCRKPRARLAYWYGDAAEFNDEKPVELRNASGLGVQLLTHDKFELANVKSSVKAGDDNLVGVMEYIPPQFDRSITWEDARLLIEKWGGPFAIKGVMSVEDAKRARDVGASAIMISNHGGRQMDGSTALDMLGRIVDAVGDDLEIIVDGGIRRGIMC